ncbi:VCBS repeat protein [Neolewinella xylanilytica]|uniref:VCBS repeat protein n=1 Tax=Neolewinella xylanilytica TaxID=1514080 RepID=A0A2S6I241_9BACT|nr:VCBS repeat-containing protein [Neolewinella xylanilytica]PPK85234.1 VCBS repeat protein [Neolewinella xylanilytica]
MNEPFSFPCIRNAWHLRPPATLEISQRVNGGQYLLLLLVVLLTGCGPEGEPKLFTRLEASDTGIDFVNRTGESDTFNILTNEYIYNGGGVGIGDFDADGRPDVFFTGCDVPNRLYLNRGEMTFEDVTETAGVGGGERWNNGVTVVDVNSDGRDDIYVCATIRDKGADRANQLFLNQGNNADGTPTFQDVAPEMGIADTSHNTQAAWLDYDLDGDLDLFLLVNEMADNKRPNDFSRKIADGSGRRTDKLYRQDREGDRIFFTDVGKEAGILYQGFALAVTVCDLNRDGAPDLYVSNDYLSNDLVYLNSVDEEGKHYFREIAAQLVKHTSYSAMGNDVVDLNNDGLSDIVVMDMLPEDNLRRKTMMAANNYTYLLNLDRYGYQPQFTRNTLQLSEGLRPDTLAGLPLYTEVAMQSGIPATDWSWAPLVADFDLDGNKDVVITNGFPRDITDKDFMDYNGMNARFLSPDKILLKIPSVKLANYAYRQQRNDGGVPIFEDVTSDWGITLPTFSNGAAYADLDLDGDLDYVVNNIDDPAHLYRNDRIVTPEMDSTIRLEIPAELTDAELWGSEFAYGGADGDRQTIFYHPHRGYLSSQGREVSFAWRPDAILRVRWKAGEAETFGPFDRPGPVAVSPGRGRASMDIPAVAETLLRRLPVPEFVHRELDFIDFNVQPMLLRKLSQQGPGVAVTDWNGDGYDDLYVSGSLYTEGSWLEGGPDGFSVTASRFATPQDTTVEELGCLFFDVDGDGDEDLYVVSGGYEHSPEEGDYRDRLYRNEAGRFHLVDNWSDGSVSFSGACVRTADYDGDGDLDLFVGARVYPHQYPRPVASRLLRNETRDGVIRFVADTAAGEVLARATNVCDALFADLTGDGRPDLLTVGEWEPPRLFTNGASGWAEAPEALPKHWNGLWNSLVAADFDNDGDLDVLAGNYGRNTILRASAETPATAIMTDIDLNGRMDFVPFRYFPDRQGGHTSYPFFDRNDFAKQTTKIKGLFGTHAEYAAAKPETFFPGDDREAYHYRVDRTETVLLINESDGFSVRPLPAAAQRFPVFGALPMDLNGDRFIDILLIGNDYGGEGSQGYLDGGNGLVLLGGAGGFQPLTPEASGFYVPGEGRALVLVSAPEGPRIVATQNSGPLVIVAPRGDYVRDTSSMGIVGGYLGHSTRTNWIRAARK